MIMSHRLGTSYDFPQTNLATRDENSNPAPDNCQQLQESEEEINIDSLEESSEMEEDDLSKELNVKELKEYLHQDSNLQQQREETEGEDPEFCVEEGVLHRHIHDHLGNSILQIVLPNNRRQEVIKIVHSVPKAGYVGAKRTKGWLCRC